MEPLPKRVGSKQEYPENNPDNQSKRSYCIGCKMWKIQHPARMGLEPSPSNTGGQFAWSERTSCNQLKYIWIHIINFKIFLRKFYFPQAYVLSKYKPHSLHVYWISQWFQHKTVGVKYKPKTCVFAFSLRYRCLLKKKKITTKNTNHNGLDIKEFCDG